MRRNGGMRRMTAALGALALLLGLAACGPEPEPSPQPTDASTVATEPSVEVPSAAPTSAAPTSAAPTAAPTAPAASAPSQRLPLVERVETADGAMRVTIPERWRAEDSSGVEQREDGILRWTNRVTLFAPDGTSIRYVESDAWLGQEAGDGQRFTELARQAGGGGYDAVLWLRSWAGSTDGGSLEASIVPSGSTALPSDGPEIAGEFRSVSATLWPPYLETQEQVDELAASGAARTMLDVLASIELTGVGVGAFPASMIERVGGRDMVRYETRNLSASFLVPLGWEVFDTSRRTGSLGDERWYNELSIGDGRGFGLVIYREYVGRGEPGRNDGEELRIGAVRDASAGLQAVSWSQRYEFDGADWALGVGLSREGGSQRPSGVVCEGTFCRSFSAVLSEGEVGVSGPDEWFGSDIEATLLDVIASFRVRHDDPTVLGGY